MAGIEQVGLGRTYSRRDLGKIFLIAAASADSVLLAACGAPPTPTETPRRPPPPPTAVPTVSNQGGSESYNLESNGSYIVDKRLPTIQHPLLESIRFTFDAARSGGSLVMEPSFQGSSEFRLVVEELDELSPQNKGFIFCYPYSVSKGPFQYHPVIRFAPREEYTVYLGFMLPGQSCSESYTNMRTYYITRDSSARDPIGQLTGRFDGVKTINPNDPSFKPRDREAAQPKYWQKGCLT